MAWASIVFALWVFLPAYVANMSPVFSAKVVPKWDAPIDGGREDTHGNRILGPGKTWRGLVGGGLAGGLAAMVVAWIAQSWDFVAGWDYGWRVPCDGVGPATCTGSSLPMIFAFGFIVGFVALVGDAVKSYFKRRTGRKRGAPWVPFDQLDFVVFGVAAMFAAAPLLTDDWLVEALTSDWVVLVALFVLTPLLHFVVNVIGYWMKLKEVPW